MMVKNHILKNAESEEKTGLNEAIITEKVF